jgi:hypothetical protein
VRADRFLLLGLCALAGCSSPRTCPKFELPACPSPPPSFATDVQPIVDSHCVDCHSAGGQEANRPLVTYADVARQNGSSGTILSQIVNCQMPPADAPQLDQAAHDTLVAWLVCGAPDN